MESSTLENLNFKNKTNQNFMENKITDKTKLIELKSIVNYLKERIYIIISIFILFICLFLFYGYILSFIFGIIFTILIQVILLYFFLGFGISDDKEFESTANLKNNELNEIKNDEMMEPADESTNQLKISYKTLNTKFLIDKEQNKDEKNSKNKFTKEFENSDKKNNDNLNNELEINLNNICINPGYYCYCKFLPDNFEKLIKMQNDIINNYSDSTIKILSDNLNNLKLFQHSFKKNVLYYNNLKTLELDFEKEESFYVDYTISKNFHLSYNSNINFFNTLFGKSSEIIETINNLVIKNVKGVNFQSINEKKEIIKKINLLIKDIETKENKLRNLSEKFYNKKKTLEKLSNHLEKSKLNNEKYESIVKIEMEIKIATKQINEIQTALSLVADEYKDSRFNFSEDSIKIYLNFMKNITREYEVLRALLLSFLEFFYEILNNFNTEFKLTSITEKNKNISNKEYPDTNLIYSFNNVENKNIKNEDMEINLIDIIFSEFLNLYFDNTEKFNLTECPYSKLYNCNINLKELLGYNKNLVNNKLLNVQPKKIENKLDLKDDKNFIYQQLDKKNLNKEENDTVKIQEKNSSSLFQNLKDKVLIENIEKKKNTKEDNDDMGKTSMKKLEDLEYEDPENIIINDADFIFEVGKIEKEIKDTINKLKELFEVKINYLKKNFSILMNYNLISSQIVNSFTDFFHQNKKTKKNNNVFFDSFKFTELNYENETPESLNLNYIFLKIFTISYKISEEVCKNINKFVENISDNIKVNKTYEQKYNENLKLIKEKFNFTIIKAEQIFKTFLLEINMIKNENIHNKNLLNLKLKKIAENFLIKKLRFLDDSNFIYDLYYEILKRICDKIKKFEIEFENLKKKNFLCFKDNCDIFTKLLEKSAKELSNSYNLEEDMNNSLSSNKIKEKINNEIIEFIVCNKDYKLDIIHEKKCPNYQRDIFNISDTEKNKELIKENINKNQNISENINENNYLKDYLVKSPRNLINNEIIEEEFKESPIKNIKTSYFNKIKNFLLKRTSNNIPGNKNKVENKNSDLIKRIDDIISDIQLKEKTYENYSLINQVYLKKEEADWFNRILETFFNRWKEGEIFKRFFKKLLYRIYNKKRPQTLDTIYIDDIKVKLNNYFYFSLLDQLQF